MYPRSTLASGSPSPAEEYSKPSQRSFEWWAPFGEGEGPLQAVEAIKTLPLQSRGSLTTISAALREGVAAERNAGERSDAVWLALHLASYQDLHASTVECLPSCIPYPCPCLPQVGCPLYDLVAREDDQLESLLSFRSLLGPMLDPHQRDGQFVGPDHSRGYRLRRVGDRPSGVVGQFRADHYWHVVHVLGEVDSYAAVCGASSSILVGVDVIASQVHHSIASRHKDTRRGSMHLDSEIHRPRRPRESFRRRKTSKPGR